MNNIQSIHTAIIKQVSISKAKSNIHFRDGKLDTIQNRKVQLFISYK